MFLSRSLNSFLIGIALLSFCFTASCTRTEDTDPNTANKDQARLPPIDYGGVYTLPLRFNPTTLDPARLLDWNGYFIAHQLFEGLVQFGPHLTVLPSLAQTWQVEERGLVYRFFLRKDAHFHNGRPVTSDDVEFSIRRLLRTEPPPANLPHLLKIVGALNFRNLKSNDVPGLKVVSAHVIVVRLTQPHAPFLTALGMYQAAIVPHEEVTRNEMEFGRNPIGSGPFKFVGWEENRSIRLERFASYHAGAAFLDGVVFRIYTGGDLGQMLTDFRMKQLMEMPAHGYIKQALADEKNLQWFHRPTLGLLFYGIRGNTHPLLNNRDFRKALSLAIDYQRLAEEVYGGQFDPARTLLPPGLPGFKPKPGRTGKELTEAREYLSRAMEKTGGISPRVEIVSAIKSPMSTAELSFVKSCWNRMGINVDIKFITQWEDFEQYLKSDAVHIYRYAWLADMPDPDSILHPLFSTDSPVNFTGYKNDRVDQKLSAARSIIDPVIRAEAYGNIERMVMADMPVIPIAYLSVDRVYHSRVQGMKISSLGFQSAALHRVWLKTEPDKN